MEDVVKDQLLVVVIAVVYVGATQYVSNTDRHMGTPSYKGPIAETRDLSKWTMKYRPLANARRLHI